MIRKEIKTYLKGFIIWTLIITLLYLGVAILYPHVITDDTMKSMDELMKVFSPEVLKAFNMDMASMSSYYGWFKTEGFTFLLMIIGIYASILGSNILLVEESEKTIEYLGTLPMKRSKIITNKIIVSILFILLMIFIISFTNYIALLSGGDFSHKEYLLLSITPILIALPLYSINLFISTFMHKTKKTLGISLGLVFIFYIINILSDISEKAKFLKYFTIYTLSDVRNVIAKLRINPMMVLISIAITIIFITGTYIRYNKKELV